MRKGQTHKSEILKIERAAQKFEAETRLSEARAKLAKARNTRERLDAQMAVAKAERDLAILAQKEKTRARNRASARRSAREVTGIPFIDDLLRKF